MEGGKAAKGEGGGRPAGGGRKEARVYAGGGEGGQINDPNTEAETFDEYGDRVREARRE